MSGLCRLRLPTQADLSVLSPVGRIEKHIERAPVQRAQAQGQDVGSMPLAFDAAQVGGTYSRPFCRLFQR